MTNFERITKSPKDLATFIIFERIACEPDWCKGSYCEKGDWDCYKCLLKWLKEESDEIQDIYK